MLFAGVWSLVRAALAFFVPDLGPASSDLTYRPNLDGDSASLQPSAGILRAGSGSLRKGASLISTNEVSSTSAVLSDEVITYDDGDFLVITDAAAADVERNVYTTRDDVHNLNSLNINNPLQARGESSEVATDSDWIQLAKPDEPEIQKKVETVILKGGKGGKGGSGKPLEQKVILIRHGEKPESGNDLSDRGYQRAACLKTHFANTGITHLFAYTDKKSQRSVETLKPLSQELNLTIDTSVKRDSWDALAAAIADLPKDSVSLVCWEHDVLTDIAKAVGVEHAPKYPSSEFDLQWTVVEGKLDPAQENC